MGSLIRLITPVVETKTRALGPYAPRDTTLALVVEDIVRQAAREMAPTVIVDTGADLDLKTVILRLEPDTVQKPFACALVLIEVARASTQQTLYTRKVESEVRRLIQPPVPLDDERFPRTALGRATSSCLRSLFTAIMETFGGI